MSTYTITVGRADCGTVQARNCFDACRRAVQQFHPSLVAPGAAITARSQRGGRQYTYTVR